MMNFAPCACRRVFVLVLALCCALPTAAQQAQDVSLTAPDGQTVTIDRDDFGVPHIEAPTEEALFFGQGFAVAQDRLFQMETFWRAATGRLAEIQGEEAAETDQNVRTVFYTPEERADQFDGLPPEIQNMIEAYVAGINTYIDSTETNPDVYRPFQYTQFPLNQGPIERWDIDKAVAVLQFFMRRFGEIGGQELERLAELQEQGPEWFDENRPINDPEAYTSVWTNGVPPDYPDGETFTSKAAERMDRITVDPDVVERVRARRAADNALYEGLGIPRGFGSFAAIVSDDGSASGNAMLLGAPQMGLPQQDEKAVTSEVELAGPAFHIAGMTVPGIPGVIIGRSEDRAWTLTTGFSDNVDTYAEQLGEPMQGVPTYLHNGKYQPFEVIREKIEVLGAEAVTYTHFRTVHGPVYAQDSENGQAFSWKYAFWDRELEMVTAFYNGWKAESLSDFEDVAASVTMSFNLFYADRDRNVAMWHVGTYPERPGDVDPRLPAVGTGEEEWVGMMDFAEQPQAVNPPQPYLVNWNNKPAAAWPQGDNVQWAEWRPRYFNGALYLDQELSLDAAVSFDGLKDLFRVVRTNPVSQEYPGTYQQIIEFGPESTQAVNVIPPGQSGFVNTSGVPSPNFADQWAFYQSSVGDGEITLKPFDFGGETVPHTESEAGDEEMSLGTVAPNPVVREGRFDYDVAEPGEITLAVYDALGRRVMVVAEGRHTAGPHTATFRAADLAPGVYVARLATGDQAQTTRFVVVR